MDIKIDDCPCSGKNMSNLAAPWALLTLYNRGGIHGYELTRIIRDHIEAMGIGLNMTGLYRHLKMLEKRGMLVSEWDTAAAGPARRRYFITDAGKECLWRWILTLTTQIALIGKFFDNAREVFPDIQLPEIDIPNLPGDSVSSPESHNTSGSS